MGKLDLKDILTLVAALALAAVPALMGSEPVTEPDWEEAKLLTHEIQELTAEDIVQAKVMTGIFSFDPEELYVMTEAETAALLEIVQKTATQSNFDSKITEGTDGFHTLFFVKTGSEPGMGFFVSTVGNGIEIGDYLFRGSQRKLEALSDACHVRIFEELMVFPRAMAALEGDAFTAVTLRRGDTVHELTKVEREEFAVRLQEGFATFCEERDPLYDPEGYKSLLIPPDNELRATCVATLSDGSTLSIGIGKRNLIIGGIGYSPGGYSGYTTLRNWTLALFE